MRPFVGRVQELADLVSALEEATSGRGSLVLVTGEPGIGKTRLMSELARVGSERGVRVVTGRCWEEGGARSSCQMRLARWRLSDRIASRWVLPSVFLRATKAIVSG